MNLGSKIYIGMLVGAAGVDAKPRRRRGIESALQNFAVTPATVFALLKDKMAQ
jgi:hypothetical protein